MGFINAWKGLFTPGELNPPVLPTPRRRMYGGAQTGRLLSDWVASATSADAEIKSIDKQMKKEIDEGKLPDPASIAPATGMPMEDPMGQGMEEMPEDMGPTGVQAIAPGDYKRGEF